MTYALSSAEAASAQTAAEHTVIASSIDEHFARLSYVSQLAFDDRCF